LPLSGVSIEHIASYVAPQPLQQISHSGKKIIVHSCSQRLATVEVSSDPLINLVDVVTDRVNAHHAGLAEVSFDLRNLLMKYCQANLLQDAAFKKAKESIQSQAPLLSLSAALEQGTRSSTKRKSPEVEEDDPAISSIGAKPSGKMLIKIAAKKSKKAKVVQVIPDSSIIAVESLDDDLDDAATLSSLTRKVEEQKQLLSGIIEAQEALEVEDRAIAQKYKEAKKLAKLATASFQAKAQAEDTKKLAAAFQAKSKAEVAKRKRLEAEEEKKRQADKAEEERIAEIARRLEMKKKEKAQANQKRQKSLRGRRKKKKKRKDRKRSRRRKKRK
jgi:chemotaxis protein histidine kinase CheA